VVQSDEVIDEEVIDELDDNEPEEKEIDIKYSLSSYGIDFDVAGLVRRYKGKAIYMPEFQRNYVWTFKKASRFIESLLLGLPVPGIFLYREEETQKLMIIDGLQRIETLRSFYEGRLKKRVFSLSDVAPELHGKTIGDLSDEMRRKLDDMVIHATIIKADEPQEKNFDGVYQIFERLNTGGMNLNPQEIRACIFHGEFQKLLVTLALDPRYKKILRVEPKRKKDQEIILRLFALLFDVDSYSGNMKHFLNNFMQSNGDLSIHSSEKLQSIFSKTLDAFSDCIKEEIIKPNKGQLNLAIFDAIFVGLAQNILLNDTINKQFIREKVQILVISDAFTKAIKTGKTHHTDSVKSRIAEAISAFRID
jgi:uncharacterized protein with ParB-like and HNH nuclease domain